jgi:trimeric autotransporter adhesin
MTQTATFPNLESYPNVATQAFLYFSSTMGALTEVDVQTSGSFSSSFSAENLGSSASRIDGTSSALLTVNLPTGGLTLSIPSVTESFNAAPFDGTANDAGTSGKQFPAVSSSSAVQTTAFTSPAELAAFTGSFRVPITVSGHANGIATSTNNDSSSSFSTQTSVTITVVYHYTPNLPSLDSSSSGSGSQTSGQSTTGSGSGTSATSTPAGTTQSKSGSTGTGASSASATHTSSKGKKHVVVQIKKPTPKHVAAATHKVARQPHKASRR